MALFPQGKTTVHARCNTGERKLFEALKRHLPDDHIVWHDLPIGDAGLQPDFVILSPRQGLLVLEVKDWKRGTLAGADKHRVALNVERGVISSPHPLAQARQHVLALVDRMAQDAALVAPEGRYRGKLLFPWGWGCALVNLKRQEAEAPGFAEIFPPERTLLVDDLTDDVDAETFSQRLWSMMQVSFPHTLTMPQQDRVRWHLFPSLRVTPQQTSLGSEISQTDPSGTEPSAALAGAPVRMHDVMNVMDMQQEREARRMGDGHRVIHGVAGSGKTMILVFRAQYLAPAAAAVGRPVLVLCFNRALAEKISYLLASRGVTEEGHGVVVCSFHSWCEDMVRTYQLEVKAPRSPKTAYFEELAATVERALASGFVPKGQYTAVMIDEAHDFEDAWLRMAVELVNPATKALLVLYDHAQAIYKKQNRKTPFKSLGIDVVGGRRSTIMRTNYRNTAEVLSLALRCAAELIPQAAVDGEAADTNDSELGALLGGAVDDSAVTIVRPDSAGRRGPMPVLHEAVSAKAEASWQAQKIAQLQAEGVRLGQIAVVFRFKAGMVYLEEALQAREIPFQSLRTLKPRDLRWADDAVRILTAHSVKGLEFSHVLVGAVDAFDEAKHQSVSEELRLLYVAMTRATLWLALSSHRESPLVQRLREQLERLQVEWASLE